MNMGILLIQMDYKGGDILFTILFTHKFIHIQCPGFNLGHSPDMRIVRTRFQIHLLRSKRQTVHLVS